MKIGAEVSLIAYQASHELTTSPHSFSPPLEEARTSISVFNTVNFMVGPRDFQVFLPWAHGFEAHLLNNFTEAGTLPVFRTESEDRMVKTANNFAAG